MREILESRGLGRIANQVAALMRPSLRLTLTPQGVSRYSLALTPQGVPRYSQDDIRDDTAIGTSKVGGHPDLPPGFEWPYWEDVALSFVAQINLADTAALDEEHLLPNSGMLYVFYDETMEAFLYQGEGDNWGIGYWDGDRAQLTRTPAPSDLPEGGWLRPCTVAFRRELTLPRMHSAEFELLDLGQLDDDWESYRLCYIDFTEERDANLPHTRLNEAPQHRMLGCPDTMYNDGRWDCPSDRREEDADIQQSQRRQEAPEALKWGLLFQIDSDHTAELNWGDMGAIYFFVHEDDLRAKRFDRVYANYEGH